MLPGELVAKILGDGHIPVALAEEKLDKDLNSLLTNVLRALDGQDGRSRLPPDSLDSQAQPRLHPLLASVFWQIYLRSPAMEWTLDICRVDAESHKIDPFVVPREVDGYPVVDLLLLEESRDAEAIPHVIEPREEHLAIGLERWRSFLADATAPEIVLAISSLLSPGLLARMARVMAVGVVAASQPRIEETGIASPAIRILRGNLVGTVGALVAKNDGTEAATLPYHALNENALAVGAPISEIIDGVHPILLSMDRISDSCVVSRDFPDVPHASSAYRVLTDMTPRGQEPVTFVGARSGPTSSKVLAWSPDIPVLHPMSQLKVLTPPVTAGGDSGAALVSDAADYLLGFAFWRSAIGEAIESSAWIWAASVYSAHNLSKRC